MFDYSGIRMQNSNSVYGSNQSDGEGVDRKGRRSDKRPLLKVILDPSD